MDKFFIIFLLIIFVSIPVCAEVMPYSLLDIPQGTLGVYQGETSIEVYSKPDKKSDLLLKKSWSYLNPTNGFEIENMFAVLKEKKELAYFYVTDIDEDFVKIIYDKKQNLQGWVYQEDCFQFLPWISFYGMYGRKYGLKYLKDAPNEAYVLRSGSNLNSQELDKLKRPKEVRLTAIQGNWALVTVLDVDNCAKTGYIRWRGDNGELYLFPSIK